MGDSGTGWVEGRALVEAPALKAGLAGEEASVQQGRGFAAVAVSRRVPEADRARLVEGRGREVVVTVAAVAVPQRVSEAAAATGASGEKAGRAGQSSG